MRGLARPPFVGRADELAVLENALAATVASRPGCVSVLGDAGVGKTRLVSEFARSARQGGARVVVGAGVDLSAGEFPFGVFLAGLRDLERSEGADGVRAAAGGTYEQVLRHLRPAPTKGASGERRDRGRLFELILDMLGKLGDDRPLVLILEDLQWADRTSLDLLRFLVQDLCQERDLLRDLPRERILLVGCWRSDEVAADDPRWDVLSELEHLEGVTHVRLAPLDPDQTSTLLQAIAPKPLPEAAVAELCRRSAGNPLFAQELLAADPGVQGGSAPSSCQDGVLRRAARLSPAARETLRALAVIGRPSEHALLAAVAQLSDHELSGAVREALDHRLLRRDPDPETYAFHHPLGQEAIYDEVLPGERLTLHQRVAEALEEAGPGRRRAFAPAELAHHWYEAGDLARALPVAVRAARAAGEVYGFAEAYAHFQRALEMWPLVPGAATDLECTLAQLQQEAAEAAHWAGATEHAVTLASSARNEAQERGDHHRAAQLSERLGRYLWELGDSAASLAADREAVRLLQDGPPSPLHARARAALAAGLMLDGESARAEEEAGVAISLSRAARALAEEGYALSTLGVCRAVNGDLENGLAMLDRARAISEQCGTLEEILRVYVDLTFVLTTAGRPQDSLNEAYAGIARTRQLGLTSTGGGALLVNAAATLLQLGGWDEAEGLARDALQQGVPQAFGGYLHLVLGDIATARGRMSDADREYEAAEGITTLQADRWFLGSVAASRAEQALWRGDPAVALHVVAAALPSLDKSDDDQLAARLCALAQRAAADLSERERALPTGKPSGLEPAVRERRQQCSAGPGRESTPEIDVFLQQYAAEESRLKGRSDPLLWAEVASRWLQLGQRYAAAYALWRDADALVASRARRKARAVIAQAAAAAKELDAQPLRREITALSQRSSLPIDAVPEQRTGPATTWQRLGLTPREQQVLPLVASGRTNRQIARALFISEKTVSVHVSNIMGKLGATNRGEAAAAAFTLELVPTPTPAT